MTTMYSAHVEVDRAPITEDEADAYMTAFAEWHGAVGTSPRGYADVQISLPAEDLAQAAATAVRVVAMIYAATPVACEVMTEKEFDARQGWESVPDLVSVSEAAELLGVSRQAVLQRIGSKSLQAEKVGTGWAIPRAAVDSALAKKQA